MKMVGFIFAILMFLNLGVTSLNDHCMTNPTASCNAELTAPCGTDDDHSSEQSSESQHHCATHCAHPVPFPNSEISIEPIQFKKTDIKSDLLCFIDTVLEGPFRPPLS